MVTKSRKYKSIEHLIRPLKISLVVTTPSAKSTWYEIYLSTASATSTSTVSLSYQSSFPISFPGFVVNIIS